MNTEFDYDLTPDQWETLKALRAPGALPPAQSARQLASLVALELCDHVRGSATPHDTGTPGPDPGLVAAAGRRRLMIYLTAIVGPKRRAAPDPWQMQMAARAISLYGGGGICLNFPCNNQAHKEHDGEKRMARLPYLEADQVAPEYRDMLKRNTNLHKLLVNSPDMARAFNGVGGFIRFKSKLDPRLRELAILQVGWMERSEYEFTHHVKIGKEFGVTDDDIAGLIAETEGKPSKLEPLAKAILRGAREMVRDLAMSDATFAEIKNELSDEHMTDLVLTIAFYCAVVRVLATMKIDNEPYYKEVLQQYPIPGVN